MAEFKEKYGILLTEEDQQIMRECGSYVSDSNIKERRRKSIFKNLLDAIDDKFVNYRIK